MNFSVKTHHMDINYLTIVLTQRVHPHAPFFPQWILEMYTCNFISFVEITFLLSTCMGESLTHSYRSFTTTKRLFCEYDPLPNALVMCLSLP